MQRMFSDASGRVAMLAAMLAACGLLVSGCGAAFVTEDTSETAGYEVQIGAGDHFSLTRDFGGVYEQPPLHDFVRRVAQKLTRLQGWTGEDYRVTLLDSGEVDIFLLDSENLYLTRGLLALLNSEAELAAIMAHVVRHDLLTHAARPRRQRLGRNLVAMILDARRSLMAGLDLEALEETEEIWGYSAAEEAAVDQSIMADLRAMGYDANAHARVLANLYNYARLKAQLGSDASETQSFRARHPFSQRSAPPARTEEGRESYFNALNGMIYGERIRQRFARRGVYVNQAEGYSFRVPANFALKVLPSGVLGAGPNGAQFAFDTVSNESGVVMGEYVTNRWMDSWPVQALDTSPLAGRPAAQAIARRDTYNMRLAAITAVKGRVYRFKMRSPTGSWISNDKDFRRIIRSFRFLNENERDALDPLSIYIFTVRAGDTIVSLARRMSVLRNHEEQFRVLNGLTEEAQLRVGQRVKLVR